MKQHQDGPADTRMMGIVHDALRRDLRRMRAALTAELAPDGERRRALAAHAGWLMHFLHDHHAGEDDGLYPMVRAANAEAIPLLDQMDAQHTAIGPCMESFRVAAETWGSSGADADRTALVGALDALTAVLEPHLELEENEMMPVAAASITQRQWHEWDQRMNVRSKSLRQLAEEGNWLLDELDDPRRQILYGEVPTPVRVVIVRGFGPGYRRRSALRWGTPLRSGAGA